MSYSPAKHSGTKWVILNSFEIDIGQCSPPRNESMTLPLQPEPMVISHDSIFLYDVFYVHVAFYFVQH